MIKGRVIAKKAPYLRIERHQTSRRRQDRCRRNPVLTLSQLERRQPDGALILLDVARELPPRDFAVDGRWPVGLDIRRLNIRSSRVRRCSGGRLRGGGRRRR